MLSFLLNCKRIYNDFIKDEVTVYAAQASFFYRSLRRTFYHDSADADPAHPRRQPGGSDARDDTASSLQHPPAD